MGRRKTGGTKSGTTTPNTSSPSKNSVREDDRLTSPPSSPTLSATHDQDDPGTETETEGEDSFEDADADADADATSTAATTGEDGEALDQVEVEPHPVTATTDHSHDSNAASGSIPVEDDDRDHEGPSTPTRSRSPTSSESQPATAPAFNIARGESSDILSPLHPPSTSSYEKPKRPFSLSSEPDTPTYAATPLTPSPKKKSTASVASPGGIPISPSLTQQVWRNSMGLPPSPVTAPSGHIMNGKSPMGLVDVNLTAADEHEPRSRVSTTLSYDHRTHSDDNHNSEAEDSIANSPTNGTFKSEAITAAFARVREESEQAAANSPDGSDEGEVVDWDFWGRVMSDYEEVARSQPRELSKAIQRGIPQSLRGMTWQLMAAAKDPTLEMVYQELLAQTSPHEKSISRDLSRTFPKHEYFSDEAGVGQENLFNVVKAYSMYDEEVGYTQGLQFIVGPLLLNMPDEETFCVLVRLMKSYDLRSHYTPNMPGLQLRLFQFDRLVEELLPGVFLHMLRQGVKSSMYASQWFLTLFGYRFPLELVFSVFDLVFAEGVEAIFRFAIALIKRNEDVLLKLEFEDLIEFLKNGLFEVYAPTKEEKEQNPNALYRVRDFVREALQVRITPMMLDQFGEEWSTLLAAQTAHTAELDALRKTNLQLSLQVRQLEASLSQINLEHCELVKQVVKARLEREELEDELVKYKIAFANAEFKAASDRASMSPLSLRRQSELSISSVSSSTSTNTSNGESARPGATGKRGNSYTSFNE
ncbi:uncharacterized protein JCM15063_006342 [Sporobolomyces koalae]|uniref:uncharacterized protein n=1 Tax=Sporobolomyces koalae TaxID=500713 RepID=UPI00316D240B